MVYHDIYENSVQNFNFKNNYLESESRARLGKRNKKEIKIISKFYQKSKLYSAIDKLNMIIT